MSAIPIVFFSWEARAAKDGRKTAIRRLVDPQPPEGTDYVDAKEGGSRNEALCVSIWEGGEFGAGVDPWRPHPWPVGSRLAVLEDWGVANTCPGGDDFLRTDWIQVGYRGGDVSDPISWPAAEVERYHAALLYDMRMRGLEGDGHPRVFRWYPAAEMPREAARFAYEVVAVSVERLHAITDDGALAEGISISDGVPGRDVTIDGDWWPGGPRRAYADFFRGGPAGLRWPDDPWQWVLTVEKREV